MIRHRNSTDDTIRRLERAYLTDTVDLNAYRALLAARARVGFPVDDPKTLPVSVETYAILLEFRILSGITTQPRIVSAARLGHEAARLAVPGWINTGIELSFRSSGDMETHITDALNILADNRLIVSFACDCAERVLSIFEQEYTGDMRARIALEAARAWVTNPSRNHRRLVGVRLRDVVFLADSMVNVMAAWGAVKSVVAAATAAATESEWGVRRTKNSVDAAYWAIWAVGLVDHDDPETARSDESLWQRQRLAQYLVGDVILPTLKVRKAKPSN